MAKYRCTVCNWIYNEEKEGVKFGDLPDSWTCPRCGAPKSAFVPEGVIREYEEYEELEIKTNVADKIIEQLEAFGVKYIFGIPGDSNLPLIEAIRRSSIKFILTRHEETAAFMADAHGKMTDEIGVCISIAGPGTTNLITGLMDATNDRSPVLALLGQIPELYLGSEGLQEIDQIELFSSFAEYVETVARASQSLRITMMAIKAAYKKPGVVVLSCPTDVLSEKLNDKVFKPNKRLFKATNAIVSSHENIIKAVKLIESSKRIAILAGWGARHSGETLIKLAEIIECPIATTSRAKGVINETHRLAVGVLGSIGTKHAANAIKSCDLLIVIGSGFRQANLVPQNVKMIQIDIDPSRIGKTFDVDVGILGDARKTLEKIIEELEKRNSKAKGKMKQKIKTDLEYLSNIEKIRNEHFKELERDSTDLSVPIYPGYVIQALKRNVDEDAIICVDVGDHTYWFYKKFICEGQKTYFSANIASMGFGLPAALSAKLDFPDKQVVCVTGDGGFAMLMADFTTAVREKLAIKIVVFNDGKLKNIKKEQEAEGYVTFGIEFPNPNFAEFAKSCGGEGFRVKYPKELDDALKKAFSSNKPSLVEIIVDPSSIAPATKRAD